MVCPFCRSESQVYNSRARGQGLVIWRRRRCNGCGACWTTHESIDSSTTLRVNKNGRIKQFSQAVLFCSLYESLKHRNNPNTAQELTDTVMGKLSALGQPVISTGLIKDTVHETLAAFDSLAAQLYQAVQDH